MGRVGSAAAIGLVTGIAGLALAIVPSVATLEDTLGLRALFLARGAVDPPRGVAIVSIDETTGVRLGLPPLVRDWPRSTHAALVDRLVELGASTIAFDIQFFRTGLSADDAAFAQSISRAARVVLIQRYEIARTAAGEIWQRQDPIPPFANAAAALAPALLPDAPIVSWFWSFLPTPHAGDIPSLAAAALQVHAMPATSRFIDALAQAGFDDLDRASLSMPPAASPAALLALMQRVRRNVSGNRATAASVLARLEVDTRDPAASSEAGKVLALARLYGEEDRVYLNFYGPSGSVCTIPYEAVLDEKFGNATDCALNGTVVFVGAGMSRVGYAAQADTYHTVYDADDGVGLTGVEIQATALSNLMDGTSLHPPGPGTTLVMLMLLGTSLGSAAYWVRTRRRRSSGLLTARLQAVAVLSVITAAYCLVAYVAFRESYLVLPLVVPVAVQLPTALVLALLVPPVRHHEQVVAVCVLTDAAGSTALGQRLPHPEYAQLMGDYNEALSKRARVRGGHVLAPQGDGFACVWFGRPVRGTTAHPDAATRTAACLAALEIAEAARRFNLAQPEGHCLPTRIGVTVGAVTAWSDADRGVFEVFGDPVNVAARLRDLNVVLGTSVLASAEAVEGLEPVLQLRPVASSFPLKGVAHPPAIVEIGGVLDRESARQATQPG